MTPEEKKLRDKAKEKEWRQKNRDKILEYGRNYRKTNKEKLVNKEKEWREKNKERVLSKRKEWREKTREVRATYIKERKKNNTVFKLQTKIRGMIWLAFKRNGYTKNSRTSEILGCTFEEFKAHIESLWEPWMTWENYGLYNGELNYGWDIDHIIPQSSAKTEERLIELNHHTNLQPLCSKVNRDVKRDFY